MADDPGTPPGLEAEFRSIVSRHGRQFRTVGDMTYEVIREGILKGIFQPGERLRQDQLAGAIGVSRIPVRSALLQLESEGLITFYPYRGAVVNKLSIDEMREIYELRAVLETHALRKALKEMTPERLERLNELARELNEVTDGEEFLARRMDFFHELYHGANQGRLVGMIERLRAEAGRYWLERRVDYVRGPGQRDHMEVLGYIERGDTEGAVQWLDNHLRSVCDGLIALMQEADESAK
jgi:DNA-binding GntR family transcriptional regulator